MASHTIIQNPRYILQLVVSCRKITAQVSNTCPATASIVAMASSSRQDFYSHYHSRLNPFPKRHRFWDSKTAALVGQKLGSQLREIGVSNVMIDLAEELSRPANQRILVRPLFDSVRCAGVVVDGLEKLDEIRSFEG
ncbi:Ribosomal L18p/L5e family protein [Melia azedarach]|uniref:Ribosomal L18p/L5e family protein n=1 Tax=Melia azedarach TaxID=155640 RepID=A0ACC1YIS0_MELAZ|nr:Ribosomal L18p/L5e family protein [Melia azedarach]